MLTRNVFSAAVVLVALAATACGGSSEEAVGVGQDQDLTSAKKAVLVAVEDDVHEHAKKHVVTKLDDALDALTTDKSDQSAVRKAIDAATPDGAGGPFYGDVTIKGATYLWADFETDEGAGPTPTGTTFVFDAKGKRVVSRDWVGAHEY